MIRKTHRSRTAPATSSLGLVLAVACVLSVAIVVPAVGAEKLVRYESPNLPSSAKGLRFTVGCPTGWSQAWGGERTRFFPADAEGPRLAATFVHIDAFARDEIGAEALLNERDGLEKWIAASRPRYEFEDRRRVKIGPRGELRDAFVVKDPALKWTPDRRELVVLVPVGDVNFVFRMSAPATEYATREPLFRAMLESFEVTGG